MYHTIGGMSRQAPCMTLSWKRWSSHVARVRALIFCNAGMMRRRNAFVARYETEEYSGDDDDADLPFGVQAAQAGPLQQPGYFEIQVFHGEFGFAGLPSAEDRRAAAGKFTIETANLQLCGAFSFGRTGIPPSAACSRRRLRGVPPFRPETWASAGRRASGRLNAPERRTGGRRNVPVFAVSGRRTPRGATCRPSQFVST